MVGEKLKSKSFFICVFCALVFSFFANILNKPMFFDNTKLVVDSLYSKNFDIFVLTGFLFFPFLQEMFFRGCVFIALEEKVNLPTLAITSSYLWIMQLNINSILDFVFYFTLGVFLTFVRHKLKNIWACYIIHFSCLLYTSFVIFINYLAAPV
jgi:membrane protease YdiL (CAAX protease family)